MKTMNFFSKFFGKNEKPALTQELTEYYNVPEVNDLDQEATIQEMIAAKNRNEEVVNGMIKKADQFEKSMKK